MAIMQQTPFDPLATTPAVLRYLVAIGDHGSFRRAAEAAGVSQPSLSSAVAQWERRMACQLFERGARGARPTPAGERVIAAAREALDALEAVERVAAEAQPPFYGPVRFGVIPTVGPYALPMVHQAVTAHWPALDLPVMEATTAELLTNLTAGRVDVAMLAILPGMAERFHVAPLYDEPFLAALPADHALANHEAIATSDLTDERLLLLDEGHCLRDQTLELCQWQQPGSQGPRYRATSLETLRHLVAAGHGVTVLPALAAQDQRPAEAIRPLAGSPSRTIGLIWRAQDPRAEAYTELQQALRKAAPRGPVKPA